MKLSDGEKLILVMLSEIHEKLKIENGVDTKLVRSAILDGHLWALKWELSGIFHNSEPADEVVTETVDILDMWRYVESSYKSLSSADKALIEEEASPFGRHVQFTGFDGNGESQYIGVARFLVDELNRFEIFKGRELNSHLPLSLEAYRRMLKVFAAMRSASRGSDLTAVQIIQILKEQIHPQNRKAASA